MARGRNRRFAFDEFRIGPHRLRLKVYDAGPSSPMVLSIVGGGWSNVNIDRATVKPFLREGYSVAVPEYRSSLVAQWPEQLEDLLCAVNYLRSQVQREPMVFYGKSAGGHLAARLAQDVDVAALVAVAAPLDLDALAGGPRRTRQRIELLMGSTRWQDASVTHTLAAKALCIWGRTDRTVPSPLPAHGSLYWLTRPSVETMVIDGTHRTIGGRRDFDAIVKPWLHRQRAPFVLGGLE